MNTALTNRITLISVEYKMKCDSVQNMEILYFVFVELGFERGGLCLP